MAEMVTKQKLENADIDVDNLGKAANELGIVDPRYGDPYKTAPQVIQDLQQKADQVVAQGFYKGYATEALLLAAKPAVAEMRARADDTRKIYRWNRTSADGATPIVGTWTDTGLSDKDLANSYTDDIFKKLAKLDSKNKYNHSKAITDWRISGSGSIIASAGAKHTGHIPVEVGKQYTMSWGNTVSDIPFYAFFANDGEQANPISYSTTGLATSPRTFTVPLGAKYVVINLKQSATATERTNFQLEEGVEATEYKPYLIEAFPESSFLNAIVQNKELIEEFEPLTQKEYEIRYKSKNLFLVPEVMSGKYLNNVGTIMVAAGWGMSGYIPVTSGKTYTLSGTRSRVGLAFFANKNDSTAILYDGSTSNPLTFTAPAGANYVAFNLYTSTAPNYSSIQLEEGSSATSYEAGGDVLQIDASYLNTKQSLADNSLIVNGNDISVTGKVDDIPVKINAWITKIGDAGDRTVFNFSGDYVNHILQRSLVDDVAPMRLDGTTIGANHGYQKSNLTLASHGKTVADIGSVWTSGGKQYVIVGIVSTSVLSITSRADNTAFSIGELVHVSGATNTASFTPTATASDQWYPAIRDRKIICFVDNIKIDLTQNATYSFKNTVKFLETYSIMKKSDIVEWLITNKGQNHVNYNAVPAYTVNFGYTFDHECGCTIYFGGVGRKTVDLVDQMITQSIQLAQGNGVVYNYIPKAAEFTEGGFTYNFSQLENLYTKNPSTPLYLTAARQETETSPIDRIIMLNDQVGYATGYLPILDAAPDVRPTKASRKYLEIRNSTLKIYPRLIDSASITQINEGDAFAAIAYRKYFKRSSARTCKYVVRSEYGDYLYLDWHTAKTDEVELPSDLVGREFEIVEKSSNVSLLSKFASNSILVKIDSAKPYGYLVLRFK